MEKEYRKISSLKGWDKNPRSIKDKDFQRLKRMIEKLGEFKPLIILEDGTVLGGNMRLRVYKELGWGEAWVSVVEADTEKEKLAYALADNERAGFYDEDLLANLTGEFPDFEWGDYAVDLKPPVTLKDLFPEETVEDEVPAVSDEPAISKLGEVYQLGRHRLMCGDATKKEDVDKLMNGQKADMVFTDPPYNIGLKEWKDDRNDEEYKQFTSDWFSNVQITCSGAIFITPGIANIGLWYETNKPKWMLAWLKMNGMSRNAMGGPNKWEPILGYNLPYEQGIDVIDAVTDRLPDMHENHPTIKPVKMIADLIKRFSKEILYEPFGGSGSTLIACEQTNRICYMSELDPKYVDVIRKRYAKFINREDWQEATPKI